jgi:hypothetical protein
LERLKNFALAAACLAIAALSLALYGGTPVAAVTNAIKQVQVVNSPTQPIPMVVSDASQPIQAVVNPGTQPIPVTISGAGGTTGTAVQATAIIAGDQATTVSAVLYQVPAGKRLVIEYVSSVSDSSLRSISITTTVGGSQAEWFFTSGMGNLVRMYADPGTNVGASVYHGTGLVRILMSGYLVDAQ